MAAIQQQEVEGVEHPHGLAEVDFDNFHLLPFQGSDRRRKSHGVGLWHCLSRSSEVDDLSSDLGSEDTVGGFRVIKLYPFLFCATLAFLLY